MFISKIWQEKPIKTCKPLLNCHLSHVKIDIPFQPKKGNIDTPLATTFTC